MINGPASAVFYYGVMAMLALVIICLVALSMFDKATPPELDTVLVALLSYLAGSHVKPPIEKLSGEKGGG